MKKKKKRDSSQAKFRQRKTKSSMYFVFTLIEYYYFEPIKFSNVDIVNDVNALNGTEGFYASFNSWIEIK
jgi:hypothetical protein